MILHYVLSLWYVLILDEFFTHIWCSYLMNSLLVLMLILDEFFTCTRCSSSLLVFDVLWLWYRINWYSLIVCACWYLMISLFIFYVFFYLCSYIVSFDYNVILVEILWLCVYAHVDTSCTEHQMCVHVYTCARVDTSFSLLVYDVDACVRARMHVHVLIIDELITHIWCWYSLIMKLY